MHRRARHLKGSSYSAILQYDSRYLTDSDGTALQTWPNRASTSYDATEATSTKRPVVKTGSNGINGQTVLSFDGIDDDLQAVNVPVDTYCTQFWCGKFSVSTGSKWLRITQSANIVLNPGYCITSQGGLNDPFWIFNRNSGMHYAEGTSDWFGTVPGFASIRYDGTGTLNKNGITQSNGTIFGTARTNSTVTDNINFCSRNRTDYFSEGLLGCYIIANTKFSDSLTRRIEQSIGFSFKIACS